MHAAPVSNSYAIARTLSATERRQEDPMGVIPSDTAPNGAIDPQARPFWQRIAQAIDHFMAQRSQRAVPAPALRRSRDDIKRCRRLIISSLADRGSRGKSAGRCTRPPVSFYQSTVNKPRQVRDGADCIFLGAAPHLGRFSPWWSRNGGSSGATWRTRLLENPNIPRMLSKRSGLESNSNLFDYYSRPLKKPI